MLGCVSAVVDDGRRTLQERCPLCDEALPPAGPHDTPSGDRCPVTRADADRWRSDRSGPVARLLRERYDATEHDDAVQDLLLLYDDDLDD